MVYSHNQNQIAYKISESFVYRVKIAVIKKLNIWQAKVYFLCGTGNFLICNFRGASILFPFVMILRIDSKYIGNGHYFASGLLFAITFDRCF